MVAVAKNVPKPSEYLHAALELWSLKEHAR